MMHPDEVIRFGRNHPVRRVPASETDDLVRGFTR
jgi:hypothetical protein